MLKRVEEGREFSCQDLCYSVDGHVLVGPVSFVLPHVGVTAIMGPNGAGKSCLLRLMHGLLQPSAGTAHWGDRPVGDGTRTVQAMVFQKPVLLRRSVRANIDYVLPRKQRWVVDELLLQVGLLDRASQPARALSGGEQQRLALARALALQPSILLLDEPTASLDPASVQIIEKLIKNSADNGSKVTLVTHNIAQARRLADDIVFIHRGKICEQGDATTFFNAPTSNEARAYLAGELLV